MTRASIVRPGAYCLGLTLLGTALSARPAHAGGWQLRLVYSYERNRTTWNQTQGAMVPSSQTVNSQTPWQSSSEAMMFTSPTTGLFTATGKQGLTAQMQVKTLVTLELHWEPGANQTVESDPPSALIFLKLRGEGLTALVPKENSNHSESNGLGTPSSLTSSSTDGQGRNGETWKSTNWDGPFVTLGVDNTEHHADIDLGPYEISAQGSVRQPLTVVCPPNHSTTQDKGSQVTTTTAFGASLGTYGVLITSDIEKSWKKWTGGLADLPNAYKQRNSSGAYLNQADPEKAVQVAGLNTPSDSSDDIWKIACLRQPGTPMTVEKAADYWPFNGGVAYGGGVFTANTMGFSSPSYKWTLTGGSPSPDSAAQIDADQATIDLTAKAYASPFGLGITFDGIDLGLQPDGSFAFNSSTLDVEVGNPDETLRAKDTYIVNWHAPVENRFLKPSTSTVANPLSTHTTDYADANPDPQSGVNVGTNITQNPLPVDLQAISMSGAYVTSVATAGGAGWGLIVLGVTEPEVVVPLTALAGAVGYGVVSELPQPNPTTPFLNNFDAWQAAVIATRNGDIRITPASLANDPNALNPDPYVNTAWRSCSMRVTVTQFWKTTTFLRDEYNSHGYMGQGIEYAHGPDGVPVYLAEYSQNTY